MSSRCTSSIPKEDVVFPRMLYCDSRCSQTFPGLSPALPGALLCNATCCLGDGKRVILRHRVRGSVRAVRAVQNTRVVQTETRVVADGGVRIEKPIWSAYWNIEAPIQTEDGWEDWWVPTWIEERQWGLKSVKGDWGVPIIPDEHHWGGGLKEPHHVQFEFDECNGFGRNAICHRGRAKFTSIFILKKHNCNLLSSGILRQRTMNSYGQRR